MFKSHLFTLMLVIAFVALLGGCGQNQKSSEEMKKSAGDKTRSRKGSNSHGSHQESHED